MNAVASAAFGLFLGVQMSLDNAPCGGASEQGPEGQPLGELHREGLCERVGLDYQCRIDIAQKWTHGDACTTHLMPVREPFPRYR
jgi:hypothetical protein